MTLQVRNMQRDDLDEVYAIERAAHKAPWSRDILSDCVLVAYDCRVLDIVNDSGQTLAGYIICRYHQNVCHVLNLCIAPALQNKGYGRILLKHVLDSFENTPIDTALLEVRPSNLSALHLYKKMGFKKVGMKEGYYRDEQGIEDAIILMHN